MKQIARGFERWLRDTRDTMTPELFEKSFVALLVLKSLDQPAASLRPVFIDASRNDLIAFTEAWAAR